jgi:hypothetical protein
VPAARHASLWRTLSCTGSPNSAEKQTGPQGQLSLALALCAPPAAAPHLSPATPPPPSPPRQSPPSALSSARPVLCLFLVPDPVASPRRAAPSSAQPRLPPMSGWCFCCLPPCPIPICFPLCCGRRRERHRKQPHYRRSRYGRRHQNHGHGRRVHHHHHYH